jgi:hypothetical protein
MGGPQSYVTPEMMISATKLFQTHAFDFTPQEKELLDLTTLDTLLASFYRISNVVYIVASREQCPHDMPLITRQSLGLWILIQILLDPV